MGHMIAAHWPLMAAFAVAAAGAWMVNQMYSLNVREPRAYSTGWEEGWEECLDELGVSRVPPVSPEDEAETFLAELRDQEPGDDPWDEDDPWAVPPVAGEESERLVVPADHGLASRHYDDALFAEQWEATRAEWREQVQRQFGLVPEWETAPPAQIPGQGMLGFTSGGPDAITWED